MLNVCLQNGVQYQLEKKDNVRLKNEGTYGNGSIDWAAQGLHLSEIAEQIGVSNVIAAKIEGELCSLDTFVTKDCTIKFITLDDIEGKEMLRRTAIFLLTYAVKKAMPAGIQRLGSNMQSAFCVSADFILPVKMQVTDINLEHIQKQLDIVLANEPKIITKKMAYYTALRLLEKEREYYQIKQLELNDDGGPVPTYMLDEYFDLDTGLLFWLSLACL